MTILRTVFVAGALCASASVSAQDGGCRPEFVDTTENVNVSGIQIGAGERARENFEIRVRNAAGNGPCEAFMRIARRDSVAADDPVQFNFSSGGQRLEVLADDATAGPINNDLFLRGVPGSRNGRAVRVQLGFPTEWGLDAGTYSREFVATLRDANGTLVDTLELSVRVNIPSAVALRIVGASGRGSVRRINLGALDPDAFTRSDPFGLRIWSTSPYRVEFTSENQGVLRHSRGRDEIPYVLRMRGEKVDLMGANGREFVEHTDSLGDLHPLRVMVDPFFAEAGKYADRVRVSVSAI